MQSKITQQNQIKTNNHNNNNKKEERKKKRKKERKKEEIDETSTDRNAKNDCQLVRKESAEMSLKLTPCS